MKKNISAKRVFKIFGIVFGAVLAFVGIVVGVMAIMGKFKTPVVYPTELIFLENDKIVIAKETYDATAEPKDDLFDIYSFELTGLNSSAEHEVNKKNCYIWFYENVGANLITLCDEFGVFSLFFIFFNKIFGILNIFPFLICWCSILLYFNEVLFDFKF